MVGDRYVPQSALQDRNASDAPEDQTDDKTAPARSLAQSDVFPTPPVTVTIEVQRQVLPVIIAGLRAARDQAAHRRCDMAGDVWGELTGPEKAALIAFHGANIVDLETTIAMFEARLPPDTQAVGS